MTNNNEGKCCANCEHREDDGGFVKGWAYCSNPITNSFTSKGDGSKMLTTFEDFCCLYWEKKESK